MTPGTRSPATGGLPTVCAVTDRTWTLRPWAVAVIAAACWRITRLATEDPFPPAVAARSAVEDWVADRAPAYAHGPTCPWCVGFWVALAATCAAQAADRRGRLDLVLLAAAPWAISAAVGAAADRELH